MVDINHSASDTREHRRELRNVLMVAFHYPPIAASAGALRSRAFASYLSCYGWQAHLLLPSLSAYPEMDPDVTELTGPVLHRALALDSKRHLGWRGRYASFTAAPDRWISWAPAAITAGLRVIRKHPIEAIWSTYPIPTAHLIAGTLARLSGLPWIAEFRDPMRPTGERFQCWTQRAIERQVIARASRLVFVTPGAKNAYEKRFPSVVGRTVTIFNGYDERLEPKCTAAETQAPSGPVRLLHSGHLYKEGRHPRPLFEALAELKGNGSIDASRLQVIFRNSQSGADYREDIGRLDIADLVVMGKRLPHREALEEQARAHALLLLQGREFNLQIPAKLFEYMRARRPILSLVDPEGDTSALLRELGAGIEADASEPKMIAEALIDLLGRLEKGDIDSLLADPERLAAYSRRRSTAKLAALLDDVVGG